MSSRLLEELKRERDHDVLARVIERHAETRGEHPFMHYGEDRTSVSYGQFLTRVDSMAGNLRSAGVQKGDRVSVFLFNPFVSAYWMFAVWRAGAVFCPINFSYAGRLLSYQLNDTAPRVVVTERVMVERLNEVASDLAQVPELVVYDAPEGAHDHIASDGRVAVDGYRELPYEQLLADASAPSLDLRLQDPANIIYTSGTTGPAKGVLQPHRWINQYILPLSRFVQPDDVVYSDLPMYHVGGAFANLGRAARVGCTAALWDRFSPNDFWDRIRSSGASTAILLDVMIPWLMSAPEGEADREHSLRRVHMQPLPRHHHEVATRFGFDFVTAGFGQTESGAPLWVLIDEDNRDGAVGELRGAEPEELRSTAAQDDIPVVDWRDAERKGLMGRPTPFMDVTVLDEDDEPCPPEQPGHLAVRPKLPYLLMLEYFNKPEATVEAFRNLWFHTGDAAMLGEDGMFYFIDRLGDRLRVRGENLSSFQVEDEINHHPQVEVSAAFGVPSDEGDEDSIVVYVVPTAGEDLDPGQLDEWCRERIPKFMRPRHVRAVDELPRTPTNKVEKYKLKQRFKEEAAGA